MLPRLKAAAADMESGSATTGEDFARELQKIRALKKKSLALPCLALPCLALPCTAWQAVQAVLAGHVSPPP